MELRLLVTEEERRIFADRLAEARAKLGIRFREKSRSQLAKIQLAFGNLYGLFEGESDPAEKMIAGISTHDLEMFPQTCPKPDLSHLAPGAVVECSDLWSLRKGAGLMVWCGMVVPLVGRGTRAALAYLAAGPEGNPDFYLGTGFKMVGEPGLYPYLETVDGEPIYAQPMVLETEAFDRLARALSRFAKSMAPDHSRVKLKNFIGMRVSSEEEHTRQEMGQAAA
ncbi:MAG TPA: hypothetical protein VMA09_04910 [Candidatus Binataceae bacterium]|nr:hypothetical protein [Candidatus Binataceae bacterium]